MTIVSWVTMWPHFTPDEMRCKGTTCGPSGKGCGRADMQPAFMDRLEALRFALGKPLVVKSGFRCPEHNLRVSTTGKDGVHVQGLAVDLKIDGQLAYAILALAFPLGFTGIGVAPTFLHLDTMTGPPRPNLWGY